jgi:class 3 adenylate cyclase
MNAKPRSSIAVKLTLLVLGGTALVLALIMGYSYTFSKKIILGEAEKNARNLTLSVSRRIEQEFRSVAKLPESLACFLETSPVDRETLLMLIRRLVVDNKEVYGVAVAFEPDGFADGVRTYAPYYYMTDKGPEYVQLGMSVHNYFIRDWYHIPKVLGAPIWTEPYFDEGAGNIVMTTYSFPLYRLREDGSREKVRGIVTADISLEWLTDLVKSIRVGKTGYSFIVSETGVFVTHPKSDWIMRESLFSLAEEHRDKQLRNVARSMLRERSGFVNLGTSLSDEEAYLAFARIPSTGWSLGAVFPKRELLEEVAMLHRTTLIMALGGVSLLILVSAAVARSIARPLRTMAGATERVAAGDLEIDLSEIRSQDEVGQLAQAFMRMTQGLKDRDRIRDTFGRYVTQEVVSRLLEDKDGLRLGGEAREITMIMSDLRGFTALTATMNPEEVITFLNRYLGKMVEILIDYRGIIDEIIGDGILAFFGAPEPLEDHPAFAVACALRMQVAMDGINDLNEQDGYARLEMGVAVNTGVVVVGNIGFGKTHQIRCCRFPGQLHRSRGIVHRRRSGAHHGIHLQTP